MATVDESGESEELGGDGSESSDTTQNAQKDAVLGAAFKLTATPDAEMIANLAQQVRLTPEQVRRWFRNRRHRANQHQRKRLPNEREGHDTAQTFALSHGPAHDGHKRASVGANEFFPHHDSGMASSRERTLDPEAHGPLFSAAGITEQARRAKAIWDLMCAEFGATPVHDTSFRGATDVSPNPFFPLIPSHTPAYVAARSMQDPLDDGRVDPAMLLGLRRIFEQHRAYFVALAPMFLAAPPGAVCTAATGNSPNSINGPLEALHAIVPTPMCASASEHAQEIQLRVRDDVDGSGQDDDTVLGNARKMIKLDHDAHQADHASGPPPFYSDGSTPANVGMTRTPSGSARLSAGQLGPGELVAAVHQHGARPSGTSELGPTAPFDPERPAGKVQLTASGL